MNKDLVPSKKKFKNVKTAFRIILLEFLQDSNYEVEPLQNQLLCSLGWS